MQKGYEAVSLCLFCSLLSKHTVGDTTSNHWLGRPSSHPMPSCILRLLLPSPDKTEGRFSAPCALENLSFRDKKAVQPQDFWSINHSMWSLKNHWDWLMALEELCTFSTMNSSRTNNFVGSGPWNLIIFSRCEDSERTHQPHKKKTTTKTTYPTRMIQLVFFFNFTSFLGDAPTPLEKGHSMYGQCMGSLELHLVVDFPGKHRRNKEQVCQPCWCCTRVEKKQGLFHPCQPKTSNQSVFVSYILQKWLNNANQQPSNQLVQILHPPLWHHRTSENYESHPLHCLLLMPVGPGLTTKWTKGFLQTCSDDVARDYSIDDSKGIS